MVENKNIEKINFNEMELDKEYYKCNFISCDFSKKELINTIFDKCEFKLCNFTLARFKEIVRDAKFIDCKMTGVDLTEFNRFSSALTFVNTHLNYANFSEIKLRKTTFTNCNIHEACFDNSDISFSIFDNCDLTRTTFSGTNLEKVDFSTSYNFTIDPSDCKLKKTIFSELGLRGLVSHLNIEIKE